MHVRRRRLLPDELPVHVEADVVRLPVHAIGMVTRRGSHLAVDLAVVLPRHAVLRIGGVDRAVDAPRIAAVMLDDIELLPVPGLVRIGDLLIGQEPEGIPRPGLVGEVGPDLEVTVLLREAALRRQQTGFPAAGGTILRLVRDRRDLESAAADVERVVARARIHERRMTEADIRVGVITPFRPDIPPGRAAGLLRDAAGVEFVVERQVVAGEVDRGHEADPATIRWK